ncbi:MAG: hypothetical protein AAF624_02970 [Bacteroidota bacterium]
MASSAYRSPAPLAEVTRQFRGLQGLRIVPLALFFLVWGFTGVLEALGFPLGAHAALFGIGMFLALVLAVFAERRIARWYDDRFGIVETVPKLGEVLGALAFVALLPAAFGWLSYGNPPVNPVLVVLGCGLLAYWRPRTGFRVHYAIAGVFILAASIYVPDTSKTTALVTLAVQNGGGMLLLVLGILDHRELVRALGPVGQDDDRDAAEVLDV